MSIYIYIYIYHIENGVLKKYIPGLCFKEITLPTNVHSVASYCMSPWSPDRLPIGEDLLSWDELFAVEQVYIPKNIQRIEKLAFADVPNLKKFTVEKGCEGAQHTKAFFIRATADG